MRRPPIISWEGVRTLEKKKKKQNNKKQQQQKYTKKIKRKKKERKTWRVGVGTQDPRVASDVERGTPSPLFCMRGTLDVWCSY